jgi:hypothetical protein
MQKNLPSIAGQHKVSASTARKKKEPIRGIFLVKNHRGSQELPMLGLRKEGIEFGARQSRKKPGMQMVR